MSIQISMPLVVFEPTTPEFKLTKTVHALDGAAAVKDLKPETAEYTSEWNISCIPLIDVRVQGKRVNLLLWLIT
jgi:hypothetical protein